VVRIGVLRRSDKDRTDQTEQRRRERDAEHATKIEEATERAAVAIRRAAESAAADRAHARARTSGLAATALVAGVVAALALATGALAGLAIVIGAVAALAAVGGLSATGRHYAFLAGRFMAALGLVLGVAAVVVGILAVGGVLPSLDADTNQVEQLRDLLPTWLT